MHQLAERGTAVTQCYCSLLQEGAVMGGVGAANKQLLDHCREGVDEMASYVSVLWAFQGC